ncbi:hypothetical protein OG417_03545 [Actinoallomurus sp. NBC_01490]|uniref:hypothetical protein n=1 Tax=Actinoallomurus sp. NBC_01490 TaxID=2903557 RepID=UPI002E36487A|nr:hypothetical protein [Actinoallomurus sp. NBC_01490]
MDQRRGPNWLGLVVAAVAALLLVSAFLPWTRVTLHMPSDLPPEAHIRNSAVGLWDGAGEARVTLGCALVAGALGLIGAFPRNGRLVAAAAIPGLVSLASVVAVAIRLNSVRSRVLGTTTDLPQVLRVVIGRQIHVSLGAGWFFALPTALAVIGVGSAALATADRHSSRAPGS